MKTGTTESGFSYSYNPAALDDMRFVDTLAELLDKSTEEFRILVCASKLIEMLLGKEQKEELYNHIAKANDGRVPYSALDVELKQIMGANEESVKN